MGDEDHGDRYQQQCGCTCGFTNQTAAQLAGSCISSTCRSKCRVQYHMLGGQASAHGTPYMAHKRRTQRASEDARTEKTCLQPI